MPLEKSEELTNDPSLEREIGKRLASGTEPGEVAAYLINLWKKQPLEAGQKSAIASFLLASGRRVMLLELVISDLEANEPIPWGHFAEMLRDFVPSEKVIDAIIEGAESQNARAVLGRTTVFAGLSDSLSQLRMEEQNREAERQEAQKRHLIEKLEFLKSQRMFNEENKTLTELGKLFPQDPAYIQWQRSYQERWAREVIQHHSSQNAATVNLPVEEEKSAEVRELEAVVSQAVIEAAEQYPSSAYDLAILLYFLDLHDRALEALRHAPMSVATDWFGLELMLEGRQFVEALGDIKRLEEKYASDPETTFAVIYARARALNGLGQRDNAVELLRSILQLRPQYRATQTLLDDWLEGQSG